MENHDSKTVEVSGKQKSELGYVWVGVCIHINGGGADKLEARVE